MGEKTKIVWCDHTFNPWIGCSKVHTGCDNCYAEADFDKRRGMVKWGPNGTRMKTSDYNWRQPLKWNLAAKASGDRKRVFCASLSDVFEWNVSVYHLRLDLFSLIDNTPHLNWLLLTKRPENIRRMWPDVDGAPYIAEAGTMNDFQRGYRENVWLGCSVSDQATADAMIPELIECRDLSPVLFVSVEPLLGPVNLVEWIVSRTGYFANVPAIDCCGQLYPKKPGIDWVIVGGESGSRARPCDVAWIRSLMSQCRSSGVPCFVKQLGSRPTGLLDSPRGPEQRAILFDFKGGDPSEWPKDLRIRDFP